MAGLNSSNGNTLVETFGTVDLDPGRHELMAVENITLTAGEQYRTGANVAINDTPPGFAGAVAFTETNGTRVCGDRMPSWLAPLTAGEPIARPTDGCGTLAVAR